MTFNRVWHVGLWQVMRKVDFEFNITEMYEDARSAVLTNNNVGQFFQNIRNAFYPRCF